MGMYGNVLRVTQQELESFLTDSQLLEKKINEDDSFNADWFLSLYTDWDGIHYILTDKPIGELKTEPNELERAFISFQPIDMKQDMGYGAAQYLTSSQVQETYDELKKLTDEIVKSKINGSKMNELHPDDQKSLIELFGNFKAFYKKASENNEAIITYIS